MERGEERGGIMKGPRGRNANRGGERKPKAIPCRSSSPGTGGRVAKKVGAGQMAVDRRKSAREAQEREGSLAKFSESREH